MTNQILEAETLETLAVRIIQYSNEADARVIEAAKLMRVARERVEKGEAGDITWYEWARDRIKLSPSRLRELHRIALADDPMKELKRIRKMADKRAMKHREKKKSAALRNGGATGKVTDDMGNEQKRLIDWAKSAPLNQVSEVLSYIRRFDDDAAIADAEESPELAVS